MVNNKQIELEWFIIVISWIGLCCIFGMILTSFSFYQLCIKDSKWISRLFRNLTFTGQIMFTLTTICDATHIVMHSLVGYLVYILLDNFMYNLLMFI